MQHRGYEDYRGHAGRARAIADLNCDAGIESDPGERLDPSHAQQAISLIGLVGKGRSPPPAKILATLRARMPSAGANIVAVRMGDDFRLDAESPAAIARPGAVAAPYCCPTYGNPSGRSWSE